jgi:hypothetical protein
VVEERPTPDLDDVRKALREHDERQEEDSPPDRDADERQEPREGEAGRP